jgi:hypothetical protein
MTEDLNKKSIGAIPFVSTAIARARVRKLERLASRFRVRTAKAAAVLATECARRADLQAVALAAKEAAQDLNGIEREVLLRRVAAAEGRVEGISPLCSLPTSEDRPSTAAELSGGGEDL